MGMTDQEKRENVIKALELCASKIETRTRVPCEICPYHNEKYHGVLGDGCCNMRSLQRDMLELLKAQEPIRPLKMEVDHVRKEPVVFSYQCPVCMTGLQRHWVACPNCGQAVKWK